MMTEAYAEVGRRVAKLRRERGLTQAQLAELLDISIKHCSAVERGVSCFSVDKLIEAATFFDCSTDYLLRGIDARDVTNQLPPTVLSIMESDDEEEKELLQDYLRQYTKLRFGR